MKKILIYGFWSCLGFLTALIFIYKIEESGVNKYENDITYNSSEAGLKVAKEMQRGSMFFIVDLNGKKIFENAPYNERKLYIKKLLGGYVYVLAYKESCSSNHGVRKYLTDIYGYDESGNENFACYGMLYRPN